MTFPVKMLFAAIACAFVISPVSPAKALMPAPSLSSALNSVNTALPVEEVGQRRHYRRYGRHGEFRKGYRRHGKRYGHYRKHGKRYGHYRKYGKRYGYHRRYRPRVSIYIAPPVYVAPPRIYAAPRVYGPPRNQCTYWANQCASNWSRRSDFIGCMRYQGCY